MHALTHAFSAAVSLVAMAVPSVNLAQPSARIPDQVARPEASARSWNAANRYAPQAQSIVSQLGDGTDCVPLTRSETPTAAEPVAAARPKAKGWDERYRGRALNLAGSSLAYCERFQRPLSLNGPVLWAKQHADVGFAKFDSPGGKSYSFSSGAMKLTAYAEAGSYRGGLVQSTNANRAYQGHPIVPRTRDFTCAGCYWEARIKFPSAYGSCGAFSLLTPDDPRNRGHLEVDVIEYYGIVDRRGHHHAIHSWRNGKNLNMQNDYTKMNEIEDFGYHTYGVDLRGIAKLDGKKVGRLAADPKYYSNPFYFLASLTLNPKEKKWTVPQTMEIDYVMAYRPRSGGR